MGDYDLLPCWKARCAQSPSRDSERRTCGSQWSAWLEVARERAAEQVKRQARSSISFLAFLPIPGNELSLLLFVNCILRACCVQSTPTRCWGNQRWLNSDLDLGWFPKWGHFKKTWPWGQPPGETAQENVISQLCPRDRGTRSPGGCVVLFPQSRRAGEEPHWPRDSLEDFVSAWLLSNPSSE